MTDVRLGKFGYTAPFITSEFGAVSNVQENVRCVVTCVVLQIT